VYNKKAVATVLLLHLTFKSYTYKQLKWIRSGTSLLEVLKTQQALPTNWFGIGP
jgi:hypothetical protein